MSAGIGASPVNPESSAAGTTTDVTGLLDVAKDFLGEIGGHSKASASGRNAGSVDESPGASSAAGKGKRRGWLR
jgi:hypothetical protein